MKKKKKKKRKNKSSKNSMMVPSEEQLEVLRNKANKREIKNSSASKEINLRKKYIAEAIKIIDEIRKKESEPFLFFKTLSIELLKRMIQIHKRVYLENGDIVELSKVEPYISDKNTLEVASKLIEEVQWGFDDWYTNI
tara:strand:+ start:675 stop:1088 length:414 start_codon:yes stop_codon:yes gene_type:complete